MAKQPETLWIVWDDASKHLTSYWTRDEAEERARELRTRHGIPAQCAAYVPVNG